jgi:hypothetical protein
MARNKPKETGFKVAEPFVVMYESGSSWGEYPTLASAIKKAEEIMRDESEDTMYVCEVKPTIKLSRDTRITHETL